VLPLMIMHAGILFRLRAKNLKKLPMHFRGEWRFFSGEVARSEPATGLFSFPAKYHKLIGLKEKVCGRIPKKREKGAVCKKRAYRKTGVQKKKRRALLWKFAGSLMCSRPLTWKGLRLSGRNAAAVCSALKI